MTSKDTLKKNNEMLKVKVLTAGGMKGNLSQIALPTTKEGQYPLGFSGFCRHDIYLRVLL